MDCTVCGKVSLSSSSTPFHCPTCARSALYPLRIQHARTLMERDALATQIESISPATSARVNAAKAAPPPTLQRQLNNTGPFLVDEHGCASHLAVEALRAETARVSERVEQIVAHAEDLRRQLEEGRAAMAARKAELAQRRADIATVASKELDERRKKEVSGLQSTIRNVGRRAESQKTEMEAAREFLAREAAGLAGLKARRRRGRDGTVREEAMIGGVRVFDLRDLNAAPHAQLSASLTHIAHLVVRVSHYLAVRLPCEITLPHKAYPLPTIFNLSSSYLGCEAPFPGSTPSHSSNTSPEASRSLDPRHGHHPQYRGPLPHPRVLALDRQLPEISKDDPNTYRLFVEAVTLLAWDVAWLCQSQGGGPFRSWEDICPIGRNLYKLLIRTSGSSTAGNATVTPSKNTANSSGRGEGQLGRLSHGATHAFLGAATSTPVVNGAPQDPFRGWRLTTPTRTIDKVRSHLQLEMQGAEWELLEERDYAGAEAEMQEEGVMVGGGTKAGEGKATTTTALGTAGSAGKDATSKNEALDSVKMAGGGVSSPTSDLPAATALPGVQTGADITRPGAKESTKGGESTGGRGANGWMRVRERSNPDSTPVPADDGGLGGEKRRGP